MPRPSLSAVALAGLLALAPGACAPPPAAPSPRPAPQAARSPAAIGETFTLDSKLLGERRVINVYVPPGYATSTTRYPVLYMPDGGMAEDFPHVAGAVDVSIKNAVIRPLIVVGIENTERRRDLAGPTDVASDRALAPNAGGADRFRAFLRDELKPLIAARYRTTPESALVGESLAGLFTVETFLLEPTLFDRYLAADPSLWWNDQRLVRNANAPLAWWTAGPKALYIATADDPGMLEGVALLLTALRIQAPAGVTWRHDPMPDEHHGTIFPFAALRGIRWLFAAPPAPARVQGAGARGIPRRAAIAPLQEQPPITPRSGVGSSRDGDPGGSGNKLIFYRGLPAK